MTEENWRPFPWDEPREVEQSPPEDLIRRAVLVVHAFASKATRDVDDTEGFLAVWALALVASGLEARAGGAFMALMRCLEQVGTEDRLDLHLWPLERRRAEYHADLARIRAEVGRNTKEPAG